MRSNTAAAAPPSSTQTELSGVIERVRFHSPDSGWTVIDVKTDTGSMVALTGTLPSIAPGERIRATGHWVQDPRYGEQFKMSHAVTAPPATTAAIEKYLASGAIPGINRGYAKKLVTTFGDRLPQVLEQNPTYLEAVRGIGPERRKRLVDGWHKQRHVREIMLFLHQHGLGPQRAAQIYKRYGDESINVLRQNPYRLSVDVAGIGFASADVIAKGLGIAATDPQRLYAAIREVIHRHRLQGHCAVPVDRLLGHAAKLVSLDEASLQPVLDESVRTKRLVRERVDECDMIFARALHEAELAVAERLRSLLGAAPPWGTGSFESALREVEAMAGLDLSLSQRRAILEVLRHNVSVITGGPGSGKTTITRVLIPLLQKKVSRIFACAPTGRAARRLAEATGLEAVTIHRLLLGTPGSHEFTFNERNPLDVDVVLVDEVSMQDIELMAALLAALPSNAALICVGDVDQLPSVGPGQVLLDMISSGAIPTVRLTEIHRQAIDSRIVVNAHRVNRGENVEVSSDPADDFQFVIENDTTKIPELLEQLVCDVLPNQHAMDSFRDVQVLTPMRRGELGTIKLNARLQARLNAAPVAAHRYGDMILGVGDRVIQQTNNYDLGVYNGDTGFVSAIDREDQKLEVTFDSVRVTYDFDQLDELALAYAMTIHKSQGSEYPAVVIPLTMEHYVLLSKRLLYTAITRGKRRVILVGEDRALKIALRSVRSDTRFSGLASRLRCFR